MNKLVVTSIDPNFLLWSETVLVWSFTCYGTVLDPFSDERDDFDSRKWMKILLARCVFSGGIVYAISSSAALAWLLAMSILMQTMLRYSILPKWVAELEIAGSALLLAGMLLIIRQLELTTKYSFNTLIAPEHLAATCIVLATLIFVIRGGTYIVRGYLKKAGTLPRTAADGVLIDVKEFNRGRLIGNLERLILTIVVVVGSYAALGFLIAAKGLVRFEEMKRDFAEYFLIGSLTSVLVALLAGLIIRFTVTILWPELLALQLQSDGS